MQLVNILQDKYKKEIERLYDLMGNESELEFMFFNYNKDEHNKLNLENYKKILEYLAHKCSLKTSTTLDISYNSMRVTINGLKDINKYISLFSVSYSTYFSK